MSTHLNGRSSSVAGLAALRDGAAQQGTLMPGSTVVGGSTPPSLLYAAARQRIDALITRHGAESPQVAAALMHWAAILDSSGATPSSSQRASLTAVADAVTGPDADVITTPEWSTPASTPTTADVDPESLEAVLADIDREARLATPPAAIPASAISDAAYADVRSFPRRRAYLGSTR